TTTYIYTLSLHDALPILVQFMPAGVLVTVPVPVPARLTVNVSCGGGGGCPPESFTALHPLRKVRPVNTRLIARTALIGGRYSWGTTPWCGSVLRDMRCPAHVLLLHPAALVSFLRVLA